MMGIRSIAAATCVVVLATVWPARAGVVLLTASLDGGQEVPPNGSLATGVGELAFDPKTDTFNFSVFVEGITLDDLTAAHIHAAPVGVSGPVIFDLVASEFFENEAGIGRVFKGATFPAAFEDALLSEGTYINIHTVAFPAGEIRGQLVPEPGTLALLAVGALAARRRWRARP
ncbi:MAG: CHRD domain-containing protein [Phycisphaerae bacterium]